MQHCCVASEGVHIGFLQDKYTAASRQQLQHTQSAHLTTHMTASANQTASAAANQT